MIKHSPNARWVMTSGGNKDGGRQWLKKMGFWKDDVTGDWMLEVNRKLRKGKL